MWCTRLTRLLKEKQVQRGKLIRSRSLKYSSKAQQRWPNTLQIDLVVLRRVRLKESPEIQATSRQSTLGQS